MFVTKYNNSISIVALILISLLSIGITAYLAMVEMALGFQKAFSYTGVMENDQ